MSKIENYRNLLREMTSWSRGNLLERRAAVAALCEPDILTHNDHAEKVIVILEKVTFFRSQRKGPKV